MQSGSIDMRQGLKRKALDGESIISPSMLHNPHRYFTLNLQGINAGRKDRQVNRVIEQRATGEYPSRGIENPEMFSN